MQDIKRCGSCEHWVANCFSNKDFGTCNKIENLYAPPTIENRAFLDATQDGTPWLETRPDFGCTLHELRTE